MDIPETRYAKTMDGIHIAYQVLGHGPTDIVYTPGFISNVDTAWDLGRHAELFRKLAGLGRLTIFDRRGTGLSDRPDRVESLALELGMNDLRAVMDATGSERAVLFGFEEGGTLAAMFAAGNPDRASALVLFSPWIKGRRSLDYPWAWSDEEFQAWDQHVAEAWGTEAFMRWLLTSAAPDLARDERLVEDQARYFRSCAGREKAPTTPPPNATAPAPTPARFRKPRRLYREPVRPSSPVLTRNASSTAPRFRYALLPCAWLC